MSHPIYRLGAASVAVAVALLHGAFAQNPPPQVDAPAPAVAASSFNRCNQGQENVWPTVEAYANIKGFPAATTPMESYRHLVLRILEVCNDGDTLVLGDRAGDSAPVFRRLMSEFCVDDDIKSDPVPGVDLVLRPNAATLSCKVTKIRALKGIPTGMPPASMTLGGPQQPVSKP